MKQFDVMANVPQRVWAIDESLLKETGKRYMTKYVDVDVKNFKREYVQKVLPGYTELVKVMAKDSEEALELVYIGTDLEGGIAQIQSYSGCTEEQAKQIREMMQSQCTGADYEWLVQEARTNAFVDGF